MPDGDNAYREVVNHSNSVAILTITKNNEVVLVKQWREPIKSFSLEIPAGKIDDRDNNSSKKAAIRELNEELGIQANNLTFLTQFKSSVGFTNETIYIYMASDLHKVIDKLPKDKGEFLEILKYPINDFIKLVENQSVDNSPTVIAGLITKILLLKGKI